MIIRMTSFDNIEGFEKIRINGFSLGVGARYMLIKILFSLEPSYQEH